MSPEIDHYKIIAIPQVDISLLPLDLPQPDGINNGGYKVPALTGDWRTGVGLQSQHQYSPIDLLVCGLEALHLNLCVTSLVQFFDTHREGLLSEHEIQIILYRKGIVYVKTLAHFKVIATSDLKLLRLLRRNAPLTFKWSSNDTK